LAALCLACSRFGDLVQIFGASRAAVSASHPVRTDPRQTVLSFRFRSPRALA